MQAALLILLSGVILLAFRDYRRQRGDRSAPWLVAAYLTNGVALALLALEQTPHPRLTIVLGNVLLLAFPGLACRALSEATGQPRSRAWITLLALDVVTVAAFSFFTFVHPSWMLRSWAAGIVTAAMYGWLILLVLRSEEEVIQPAVKTMAWLFALHIAVNAARLIVWRYTGTQLWFSGMNILTIGGVALCPAWMDSLRKHESMERTAMSDPLTGLYNRRALDAVGVSELRLATAAGQPSSALMLDVDNFKEINDTQGHGAGDAALRAISGILRSVCPISMRIGGDEFLALLPGADEHAAGIVESQVRMALAALALQTPWGEPYILTVSIGSATLRGATTTLPNLMHASDVLLYQEKQARAMRGNHGSDSWLTRQDRQSVITSAH
ncbi:GGDEF domain-containing protein [Terriglobus roseus]|nr:GGDEF domain-containing protein [Terriglobus roseus]